MKTEAWTYEGYWNTVFGPLSPEDVIADYGLIKDELDEWIGQAESVAASEGRIEMPKEWEHFHQKALRELGEACECEND